MQTDRWIHDFAQFANNLDPVNRTAYPHQNFNSTFYWSWNGNNFPQLGLVNAVSLSPASEQHSASAAPCKDPTRTTAWLKAVDEFKLLSD